MTPVIDADAHVTEPPDLWTSRMSSQRWGEYIPRVQYDDEVGMEAWYIGDERIGLFGASSMVNDPDGGDEPVRWPKSYPDFPRLSEIHPSSWDTTERLKVMDRYGVAIAALYGNLGVSKNYLADVDDLAFRLEIVRTYNDFLVEWIAPAPERFIALANIPFWDAEASAAETSRVAGLGHKGIVMTGIPERHGLPPFASQWWDVLWEACTEHRMPIHFHAGGGDISAHVNQVRRDTMGDGAMMASATTNVSLDTGMALSDLLHSGVLPRFPETRWVVVESAVGYIPFVLECSDQHFSRYQADDPHYEALPSEYFRRQVYGTYWFEKLDRWLVDKVGSESILFETDYPHPTCLTPQELETAANDGLGDIDPLDRQRILWKNAAELYGLDAIPEVTSLAA